MSKEKKHINKKIVAAIVILVLVAVELIPTLYSFTYLSAFWDSYGKVSNVPVAFVNMDKSVVKGEKTYSIGKELEEKLRDNDSLKWNFVDYNEAKEGVEGKKYYAMIVIPEDFSKKISDAKDGVFNKPELIYECNKGKNFIFSSIASKAADNLKAQITQKIQEETSKTLVDNLYTIKDSLGKANDGASKLHEGTKQLMNGSKELSNGLEVAAGGSGQLQKGLKEAATGEGKVTNGMDSLIGGLNQLKIGLTEKNENVNHLVDGAHKVSVGADQLYTKANEANKIFTASMNVAADIADKSPALLDEVKRDLEDLKKATKEGKITKEEIIALISAKEIKIEGLKEASEKIAPQLRSKSNSLNPLVEKIAQLNSGAKQVADGTGQLAKGIEENQNKAANGVDKLLKGAKELKDGSNQLLTGLNTASEKTGELSEGLNKLNSGAGKLNSGLVTANDGTKELSNGLSYGYKEMSNNLSFTSEDMSQFVKEPVQIDDQTINNVKHYGEGLAPYFISLSLWLGAMFVNLVLTLLKKTKAVKNKFVNGFIGQYLIGAVLVAIQSLIVSTVLLKGLSIQTVSTEKFYLTNLFISLVYLAVQYGASYGLGIIATPIMFVLFVIQLSSSAGTFPIETAPTFFRAINPYIPMSYAITILRMIIAGINENLMSENIHTLIIFMVAFLGGGLLVRQLIDRIKKIHDDNKIANEA